MAEKYSDVITPPIQIPLLEMILYPERVDAPEINENDDCVEDPSNPDYFQLYKTGVERYLEVVEGSDKLISATIPLLEDRYRGVVDLLDTIIEHDAEIDMWSFNLLRHKPTSPKHRDQIQAIQNFLRRHGVFSATLKYAINVRHSYAADEKLWVEEELDLQEGDYLDNRSAENLALAGYGFDIIGGNHWSPPQAGNYQSKPEVRLYDQKIGAYWACPPEHYILEEIWPSVDGSAFDVRSIIQAANDDDINRVQKPINAERLELSLAQLRGDLDNKRPQQFINRNDGVSTFLGDSLEAMAKNWEQSNTQATLGERS